MVTKFTEKSYHISHMERRECENERNSVAQFNSIDWSIRHDDQNKWFCCYTLNVYSQNHERFLLLFDFYRICIYPEEYKSSRYCSFMFIFICNYCKFSWMMERWQCYNTIIKIQLNRYEENLIRTMHCNLTRHIQLVTILWRYQFCILRISLTLLLLSFVGGSNRIGETKGHSNSIESLIC